MKSNRPLANRVKKAGAQSRKTLHERLVDEETDARVSFAFGKTLEDCEWAKLGQYCRLKGTDRFEIDQAVFEYRHGAARNNLTTADAKKAVEKLERDARNLYLSMERVFGGGAAWKLINTPELLNRAIPFITSAEWLERFACEYGPGSDSRRASSLWNRHRPRHSHG